MENKGQLTCLVLTGSGFLSLCYLTNSDGFMNTVWHIALSSNGTRRRDASPIRICLNTGAITSATRTRSDPHGASGSTLVLRTMFSEARLHSSHTVMAERQRRLRTPINTLLDSL